MSHLKSPKNKDKNNSVKIYMRQTMINIIMKMEIERIYELWNKIFWFCLSYQLEELSMNNF